MKLLLITETTQKAISLLRRAGVDINNPAVLKLIKAEPFSHKQPGDEQNELRTLLNNSRLVIWTDLETIDPNALRSLQTLPRDDGYLVFKPENLDVAQLLNSVPNHSAASDILNGLAFGYGYKKTLPWAGDRQVGNRIRRWLMSAYGFDAHRLNCKGHNATVFGLGIPELAKRLHADGIGVSTPPGSNPGYSLTLQIPSNLPKVQLNQNASIGEDFDLAGTTITEKEYGDNSEFRFVLDGTRFVVDVLCYRTIAAYFENDGIRPPSDIGHGSLLEAHFRALDEDGYAGRAKDVRVFTLFNIISQIIRTAILKFQPDYFLTTVNTNVSTNKLSVNRRAIYTKLLRKIGKLIDPAEIVGKTLNTNTMIAARLAK